MMDVIYFLAPLFFLTALVYASVGFGGGSTYLALLVLFQLPYPLIPKVALLCNVVVVTGGLYHYIRTKNFNLSLVLPFIITSIPFAYLGGKIHLSKKVFLFLLASSLLAVGLRMLLAKKLVADTRPANSCKIWVIGLPLGAVLGLLSGMVGIGGGIFLSPIFYFLGWGNPRQIAAASGFFIFVNSIAGLMGQWAKESFSFSGSFTGDWILPLVLAVFLGGQIGSRWSVGKLSPIRLQQGTALLMLSVATRIFWSFL